MRIELRLEQLVLGLRIAQTYLLEIDTQHDTHQRREGQEGTEAVEKDLVETEQLTQITRQQLVQPSKDDGHRQSCHHHRPTAEIEPRQAGLAIVDTQAGFALHAILQPDIDDADHREQHRHHQHGQQQEQPHRGGIVEDALHEQGNHRAADDEVDDGQDKVLKSVEFHLRKLSTLRYSTMASSRSSASSTSHHVG